MNPFTRLADAAAQRDLAQTKAGRDKWRRLAGLLGRKLRVTNAALIRQRGQIAHQNQIIQDQHRELVKLRRHRAVCPTAEAVADHDADKARSNA